MIINKIDGNYELIVNVIDCNVIVNEMLLIVNFLFELI